MGHQIQTGQQLIPIGFSNGYLLLQRFFLNGYAVPFNGLNFVNIDNMRAMYLKEHIGWQFLQNGFKGEMNNQLFLESDNQDIILHGLNPDDIVIAQFNKTVSFFNEYVVLNFLNIILPAPVRICL